VKYRKKPLIVDAMQFTERDKDRVFNWMSGNRAPDFEGGKPIVRFRTVHGETAIARLGDWVVEDSEPGTYYPVKPGVFEATYEPA